MIDDDDTGAAGTGANDLTPDENSAPATETGGSGNGSKKNGRDAAAEDEPVGYGRPPKHSQFKPGHSGNPRGRPKSARGLKTLLRREMNERVRVTENGKTKTLSKLEVIVKRMTEQAAKGDARARAKLLELNMVMFGIEDEESRAAPLTVEEQQILRSLQAKRSGSDAEAGYEAEDEPRDEADQEADDGEDDQSTGGKDG